MLHFRVRNVGVASENRYVSYVNQRKIIVVALGTHPPSKTLCNALHGGPFVAKLLLLYTVKAESWLVFENSVSGWVTLFTPTATDVCTYRQCTSAAADPQQRLDNARGANHEEVLLGHTLRKDP